MGHPLSARRMKVKIWPFAGFLVCPVALMVIATISTSPAVAEPETQPANSISVAKLRSTTAPSDQDVMNERRAITLELLELTESGASTEQISAWNEKNSTRLAANQQKLAEMSASQNSVPQPYIRKIQIPRGASQAMEIFLMEHTKLSNEQVSIQNQLLQASPQKRGEALEA